MKRIPGIEPRFEKSRIVRPDGTVLEGWEMFIGERSYGRSDSKEALHEAWEARLEEAENAKPFAFRPMRRRLPERPANSDAAAPGDRPAATPKAPAPEAATANPSARASASKRAKPSKSAKAG